MKCFICGKEIPYYKKSFSFKEKLLYQNDEGTWYNWKRREICKDCMFSIRDYIKEKTSND